MRDVTEFLAAIELNRNRRARLEATVTYQDSCHLAARPEDPQRARASCSPQFPVSSLKELPYADICCGSAGIYNVVQNEMSLRSSSARWGTSTRTGADDHRHRQPGLHAATRRRRRPHGNGQRVMHVVELLDEAYGHTPAGQAETS